MALAGSLVALAVFLLTVTICVVYALLLSSADAGARPSGLVSELGALPPPPPP